MPQPRRTAESKAKEVPIQRATTNAWWCPCCDHSQVTTIETCANCGAQKRGDKVTIPAREAA